ncbi:MAG: ClbS/DfsB family four-helix bundle protein [Anaerolineales bacterium]|nr:ClbS/DfsB family four-helix bundle protein [Anaerolineales bacterium]MCZ2122504.1 ClbS/DfsB family four-helix bundle protein [Anaerolineales bacterium]
MTERWMPSNKTELIAAIKKEWDLLIELAESLSDEQMTQPDAGGWSPKDNLAHLAEWLNILLGYHMDKKPAHEVIGISKEQLPEWDFEKINPLLFDKNKNLSREEMWTKLNQAYGQVAARLESISYEDLLQPRHADDPEKRPILLWVLGDTSEHFLEHRETIERGLKEK